MERECFIVPGAFSVYSSPDLFTCMPLLQTFPCSVQFVNALHSACLVLPARVMWVSRLKERTKRSKNQLNKL